MFNDNEFVLFSNMFKHANPTILSELTSSHSFPPLLLHPSFPLHPLPSLLSSPVHPSFIPFSTLPIPFTPLPSLLSSLPFLYSLLHPSYPLYSPSFPFILSTLPLFPSPPFLSPLPPSIPFILSTLPLLFPSPPFLRPPPHLALIFPLPNPDFLFCS